MSDIELVIEKSRALEQLLESRLGATGRGLHEKVSSVEPRLSASLVKRLRWIATTRNRVVHEGASIPDPQAFSAAADQSYQEISAIGVHKPSISAFSGSRSNRGSHFSPKLLLFLVVAAVVGFYIQSHEKRHDGSVTMLPAKPAHPPVLGSGSGGSPAIQHLPSPSPQTAVVAPTPHRPLRVSGSSAGLLSNPYVRLTDAKPVWRNNSFGEKRLYVEGKLQNISQRELTSFGFSVDVATSNGHRLSGIHAPYIILHGISPGHSRLVHIEVGGMGSDFTVDSPDVERARYLHVHLRLLSVQNGLYHSLPLTLSAAQQGRSQDASVTQDRVSLVPNAYLELTGAHTQWLRNTFGEVRLYVLGSVRNISRHTLTFMVLNADLRTSNGKSLDHVQSNIIFLHGILPRQTLPIRLKIGGTGYDFSVDSPDIKAARFLSLKLHLVSAKNGTYHSLPLG